MIKIVVVDKRIVILVKCEKVLLLYMLLNVVCELFLFRLIYVVSSIKISEVIQVNRFVSLFLFV